MSIRSKKWFLCPYGVLLNLISRFSKKHLTITPSNCIQCHLCKNSCPFGAIQKPVPVKIKENRNITVKRFILLSLTIPLLVFIGGWTGAHFHETLSKVNPKVRLAQDLLSPKEYYSEEESIEITAFRSSGKLLEELYSEASTIVNEFYIGGWLLGGFIGIVFGLILIGLSRFFYRTEYTPDKGTCLSCARCVDYCPIEPDNND